MNLDTVIFDMDGLLIDSEPFWGQALVEVMRAYNINFTEEQHRNTTGLRTSEAIKYWFQYYKIDPNEEKKAEELTVALVLEKVAEYGNAMPGAHATIDFFLQKNFKIGIASSSSMVLIDLVVDKLQIRSKLQAIASAEHLPYGKPHPQVYLNCAEALQAPPSHCLCFEDSFNGMIAAKAARMKCVVVPTYLEYKREHWSVADLKIASLQNFGELNFQRLNE